MARLRDLHEEGPLHVLGREPSSRHLSGKTQLRRGSDLAVMVAVVKDSEHGLEELLEMLDIHDLLGRELLDEPPIEAAVVGLDLSLGLGIPRFHTIPVDATQGEASTEDL